MSDPDVPPEVLRKFEEAAKVVRERTLADRDRTDNEEVKRILEAIAENLFRRDFKVSDLNPSRAARAWFAEAKETTPDGYRRVRRVEVTLYLLDHTDAEVPIIARLVGYGYARSLTAAFKRVMEISPSEERRRWRAGLVEGQPPGSAKPQVPRLLEARDHQRRQVVPMRRKAVAGALPLEEAPFLIAQVRFARRPPGKMYMWRYAYVRNPAEPPRARRGGRSPSSLSFAEEMQHVEAAARTTLEVLNRFDPELPRRLRGVLAQLRENLLRPDYKLATLKDELFVDNMDLAQLTRLLGIQPWQSAIEAKMEIGSRLLYASPLSVHSIAVHLGYSGPPQFRAAFKKWSGGLAPSAFRAGIRAVVERAGPLPAEYLHWRFLEGLEGAAPEEKLGWVRYMEDVYGLEVREEEAPPIDLRLESDRR